MKKFNSKELTPGEFFDRFTILIRKTKFDSDNYISRMNEYVEILNSNGFVGELLKLICELQMLNTDIWNLESEIRMGREDRLGLSEVGKRALEIRNINSHRISIVNQINKLFGIKSKETKFNHASE